MGEFTLSGNGNIGISSAVEFSASVNSTKNNSIFYTTPTTVPETNLLQTSSCNAMQDEIAEKSPNVSDNDTNTASTATIPADKTTAPLNVKECGDPSGIGSNGLNENKLSEQVPQSISVSNAAKTPSTLQLGNVFSVSDASSNVLSSNSSGNSTPALWSSNIEDSYMHNMQTNVNGGGLTFQNFVSYNNNVSQPGGNQASGRRAITASHNFPHTAMGRQQVQPNHSMYKGYNAWPNSPQQQHQHQPQQHQHQQNTWSGGAASAAPWNRGRSVPNLNPMQQIGGLVNRKPSPTFSHQHSNMVISPVKFRRSTSYPGKGIFTQPPTFEITNMDDNRELLPYQVTKPKPYHNHTIPYLNSPKPKPIQFNSTKTSTTTTTTTTITTTVNIQIKLNIYYFIFSNKPFMSQLYY